MVFRNEVDNLNNFLATLLPTDMIVIAGDMNCSLKDIDYRISTRDFDLNQLLEVNELCCLTDRPPCVGPAYTFDPYNGAHTTYIDHIFVSWNCSDLITGIYVADDHYMNVSDHLPVHVGISIH